MKQTNVAKLDLQVGELTYRAVFWLDHRELERLARKAARNQSRRAKDGALSVTLTPIPGSERKQP